MADETKCTIERRYVVFKDTDLGPLNIVERAMLDVLATKVANGRTEAGKPPLNGLFIEHDWEIYPVVHKILSVQCEIDALKSKKQATPRDTYVDAEGDIWTCVGEGISWHRKDYASKYIYIKSDGGAWTALPVGSWSPVGAACPKQLLEVAWAALKGN